MVKLLNIDAATGADIQYDGTDPILKLNNSSGAALEANSLVVSSSATIAGIRITSSDSIVTTALDVNGAILAANATVATGIDIRGASVASGALMSFSGDALVSCTTIKFTTGGVNGTKAIRVVVPDGTFAWIPVLPDGAVTGAAL